MKQSNSVKEKSKGKANDRYNNNISKVHRHFIRIHTYTCIHIHLSCVYIFLKTKKKKNSFKRVRAKEFKTIMKTEIIFSIALIALMQHTHTKKKETLK